MFEKTRLHLVLYIAVITLAILSVSIYTAEAVVPERYVTQTGAGTKDGSTWANALGEAEFAALTKETGTTGPFWVAKGIYRPSTTGDKTQSFQLQSGMEIYGGFKGDETSLNKRNPLKYPTIFTGDLEDNDSNKDNGITTSADNIKGTNSYTVVIVTGGPTESDNVIDGVTITAGNNVGGGSLNGGGMFFTDGSTLIKNCTFAGNKSASTGGGIYSSNKKSILTIENCTFYGNNALAFGGAIYVKAPPSGEIVNSTFYENSASSGGAIYLANGPTTITNCTIVSNSAGNRAGGLYLSAGNIPVKNSIIWGNTAPLYSQIDSSGSGVKVSYSIVEGGAETGTNITTTDPLLESIDLNGGYTKTCLIGKTGSAIGAGTSTGAPSHDQRGIARPVGAGVDIGSVEYSETANSIYVYPASVSIKAGSSYDITSKIFPVEASGSTTKTWASSNDLVATVSDGTLTAVSVGTAVITATSSPGGFTDTCEVTVTKSTSEIRTIPIASAITYGETLASSILSGGSASVPGEFTWAVPGTVPSVSDSEITEYELIFTPSDILSYETASVNKKLVVNRAQTVYEVSGYDDRYDLKPHGISVTITTPVSGATVHYGLTPGIYDTEISPTFTDVGDNTVYFRITSQNYTEETGSAKVIIREPYVVVTGVTVDPATLSLNAGYTSTLKSVVTPDDATDNTVRWSSSETSVASVNSAGRVTGISAGTATITATSTDGDKTGTCQVTVNNVPQPVIPPLPSDTPESIHEEVKPVTAEFTEDTAAIISKIAEGTITSNDLTTNPTTGLVEVKSDLAVSLFNEKDLYKEIGSGDITVLPIFTANVVSGKTAAVSFKVKGSELFAATADKVKVMKTLSSSTSDFFTYAGTSATFTNKKYTIQTENDSLYTGNIEADKDYYLVLFIKDGGDFDLDKAVNGEVVDPAVIVKALEQDPPTPESDNGGGSGCSTSFPMQMLLILIPLAFVGRSKK